MHEAAQKLKEHFGYESFRDGQEALLDRVFHNTNTMGIMPTGGGKSITYQIPSLLLPGITLVISPLISLMKDQVDELKEAGIHATFINSSLSAAETQSRLESVRIGVYKLVFVAPERLEAPSFLRMLKQCPVSLLAVDEAHCLSQWGHDFRPSYRRIPGLIEELPSDPVVLALTATATPTVTEDICASLGIAEKHVVKTGFARDNLSFFVEKGVDRDRYLIDYISRDPASSGIIYCATRKEVERVYAMLLKKGISIGRYHGGMEPEERRAAQEAFVYEETNIIVATNAFGMGINKSNVRFILHQNMPRTVESYYQEAGRAGRDGGPSDCILLFSPQDVQIQQFLIEQSQMSEERKQQEFTKLQQMVHYCHTEACLQQYMIHYFGDISTEVCGRCSTCLDERETEDITRDAQMVFSCVRRMGERFGRTMTAQVLTGSKNQKIQSFRFDRLTTFGLMKDRTQKEVSQLIDYLSASGYLRLTGGAYPQLALAEAARPVLQGEENVSRKKIRQPVRRTEEHPLFSLLRALRTSLAKDHGTAPYMIFSDQTLHDMCSRLPETEADMLEVKGVGQNKYDSYGKDFLDVIQTYQQQQSSESRRSFEDTALLYQTGMAFDSICEARGLKTATVENHLLEALEAGWDLDMYRLVEEEDLDAVAEAIDRVGTEDGLKAVRDAAGDVSYFAVKLMIHDFIQPRARR
ncbi:DNA helicase RecQ [Alkalicoccus chagannorensis]